tara:strand:+ start:293 stop:703 length:411 start_codon:yes stop_codon:yes gene_type:complete
MSNPLFNLKQVAQIPYGSDWDLEFKFYKPDAANDDAANAIGIAAGDDVRFRLWKTDAAAADVTITESSNSPNGSTLTINEDGTTGTIPARVTVDLDGDDTKFSGIYKFIVDVKDASDSNRYFPACYGTINFVGGPA